MVSAALLAIQTNEGRTWIAIGNGNLRRQRRCVQTSHRAYGVKNGLAGKPGISRMKVERGKEAGCMEHAAGVDMVRKERVHSA